MTFGACGDVRLKCFSSYTNFYKFLSKSFSLFTNSLTFFTQAASLGPLVTADSKL